MSRKKLFLSLLSLAFGSTLMASNIVYATGNPAESHDSTSPTRRVEDMNYSYYLSYNDGGQGCQGECHKNAGFVNQAAHHESHRHHQHHHGHGHGHHKHGHGHHGHGHGHGHGGHGQAHGHHGHGHGHHGH